MLMVTFKSQQAAATLIANNIRDYSKSDAERGALLVLVAEKLNLTCAVFTPAELGDDASSDEVIEAMIVAGNQIIG
jgi:hypothetical protein